MTKPTTPTPAAAGVAPTPSGRLAPGELRRRVAHLLVSSPTEEFTPRTAALALDGRSSGAVGNALASLTALGQAELVGESPRRYRATTTTVDATIAAPTPKAVPKAAPLAVKPRSATPTPVPVATPAPAAPISPAAAPATSGPTGAGAAGAGVSTDPVTGPVTRPNGQLYHPRTLSGLPDVTALRRLRAAGVPALLYGPPGTGKTSVAEAAFPDLVTVAGDADTTVADLVGEYTQTPDGR
nr:AAA family ATPase [Pseudonocardiales bacterium]